MVYLIAFIAAMAGFLFGFDEGIIGGVLERIIEEFGLKHYHVGLMMGLLPLSALVTAFCTGKISDRFGRRPILFLISLGFLIACIAIYVHPSFIVLCISRILFGATIGMSVVVAPMYIAETAPKEIRGKLVIFFQLAITLGILSSYIIQLFFPLASHWSGIFLTGLVPGGIFLIGCFFIPESPRWLFLKNRVSDAHAVLYQIYGKKFHPKEIESELGSIKNILTHNKHQGVFRELFSKKGLPCLLLGVMLFLFQQSSGINAVIYFAPAIFQSMQLGDRQVILLATVGIGLINTLSTFLSFPLVERVGRRTLLMLGFAGATIFLICIAIFAQLQGPIFQLCAAISIFLYISSFAIGIGPVPFILISEVFPLKIRGQGMSFAAASNWMFNSIVVAIFPTLLLWYGISYTFLIYGVCCALGFLYTLRFVPETKGLSLEEIEQHIRSGKSLRSIGS